MKGAWHFLFYCRGPYIRRYMKEASNWNEYKENTLRIGFRFHSLKLSRKSWLTLSFNVLGGLCKERYPKQTADNFRRRALWRKIMETLKTSTFIFIIVNLVKKSIPHFLITNNLSTDCSKQESIHRFFDGAL